MTRKLLKALLGSAAIGLCILGCGKKTYDLGEVSGTVTIDGRPLSAGTVLFIPDQGVAASGQIQADGAFRLTTAGHGNGAIVGHHHVCILPPNPLDRVENLPSGPIDGPAIGDPIDVALPSSEISIPGRYHITETSGLSADVAPGQNRVEFVLIGHP